ncbi:MAG TPA: alanine--glyoxylate aminotransferase family protein [Thermoanaerobaculia bacterium]
MPRCKYFVPGPTWVRPEILEEMTRPMIGHRSNDFKDLFRRIRPDLRELFGTKGDTFVFTASGTGVMQAALVNCVARRVLVTVNGAFSERWFSIAQSLGYEVDRVEAPWGEPIDPEMLADHIASRRTHYDAVTLTHNETSTGVTNDVATLAKIVRDESPDALVLVDVVSSLGGIPVEVDAWGLDVCLASVQKGLALPPGITVAAVSEAALARAAKHPYRGTYFDLVAYKKNADDDSVPFTPSVPHIYALARQLDDMLRKETLAKRFERHRQMRDATIERVSKFAELAANREFASPTVSAFRTEGDPEKVRAKMKERGYTLGGGYGEWKSTTFRIGHMGDIPLEDLEAMLDDLQQVARG